MPDQFIVGIDIGSSKLCSAVALRDRDGAVRYVGHGSTASGGLRAGEISDPEALGSALRRAVEEARYLIGVTVEDVVATVAGARIETLERMGGVDLGSGKPIDARDIRRALEDARGRDPGGWATIHRVVRAFAVDSEPVDDPTGRFGRRLDAWTRDFAVPTQLTDGLRRAADIAGINVHTLVPTGVAVASAVSSQSERESGVAVIDIGSATTDIAVYLDGELQHLASIPLGGHHITADVASILEVPVVEADRLKREHGAISEDVDEELIEWTPRTIAALQRQAKYGTVPGAAVRSITAARTVQIIDTVKETLDGFDATRRLGAGAILTGGASQLVGIVDITRAILGTTVRTGQVLPGRGFPSIADPGVSAAVGLIRYVSGRAVGPAPARQRSPAATGIVHPTVMNPFAWHDTIDVTSHGSSRHGPAGGSQRDWGRVVRDWVREFIPASPED